MNHEIMSHGSLTILGQRSGIIVKEVSSYTKLMMRYNVKSLNHEIRSQ